MPDENTPGIDAGDGIENSGIPLPEQAEANLPVSETEVPVPEAVASEAEPPLAPETPEAIAEVGAPEVAAPEASAPATDGLEAMRNLPPEQAGGIEILIAMAEKGEIDPKNIDIIDVTDRFLQAIAAAPKENLRQSGKIIFQASVLLRMKAEALLAAKVEEEVGYLGDDYVDYDADGMPIIYDSNSMPVARQITLQELERALVRQTKGRQLRHRRVTLEQLIEALRDAERVEKSRSERKVKPTIAVDGYSEMRDMDDILDLACNEDVEDTIERIERLLADLFAAEDLLPLLKIIQSLNGRGDWVDAFLAVLFLSNAGKITLQQEQFYGPLFIARAEGDTSAMPVVPPASADAGAMPAHN